MKNETARKQQAHTRIDALRKELPYAKRLRMLFSPDDVELLINQHDALLASHKALVEALELVLNQYRWIQYGSSVCGLCEAKLGFNGNKHENDCAVPVIERLLAQAQAVQG